MNAFQNLLVRKQKVMAWITRLTLIQNKNALFRFFVKLIRKPFVHLAYVFPKTMFQFVQLRFQTLGIYFKIKQIAGTFSLSVVFSMREFVRDQLLQIIITIFIKLIVSFSVNS